MPWKCGMYLQQIVQRALKFQFVVKPSTTYHRQTSPHFKMQNEIRKQRMDRRTTKSEHIVPSQYVYLFFLWYVLERLFSFRKNVLFRFHLPKESLWLLKCITYRRSHQIKTNSISTIFPAMTNITDEILKRVPLDNLLWNALLKHYYMPRIIDWGLPALSMAGFISPKPRLLPNHHVFCSF